MDTSLITSNIGYIGLFVAVLTGLCLVTKHVKPILSRLARNPPQAIPPKTQKGYRDALPAQRRHVLDRTAKGVVREVDVQKISRHILSMTTNYQTCQEQRYTPTGFSVQEIRDLGDFPDYAKLSGLPNPQPYDEFDIDKALPRPYRPFRWAYHQTMCTSSFQASERMTIHRTNTFISNCEDGE